MTYARDLTAKAGCERVSSDCQSGASYPMPTPANIPSYPKEGSPREYDVLHPHNCQ